MKLTPSGVYQMTLSERIRCIVLCGCLCFCAGWLFYDQTAFAIAGLPLYGLLYRKIYQFKKRRCDKQLRLDFKDTMLSVYSSLSAGATLEESLKRAAEDMKRSLKADSRMVLELEMVCQKMERNVPVSRCMEDMSVRCANKDIENFTQILILAKKQGGNMAALVRESVEKIQHRIEMTYEIEGILGAKRNEFFFMCMIPAGVIFYMRVFSSDFMDVLYGNVVGICMMTLCLGVYVGAFLLGMKILKLDDE